MSSSTSIFNLRRIIPKTGGSSSHKEAPIKSSSPRVNFNTENVDLSDRKKKYLTAKYGQHQMSLIKKRLRVEMWMYEQLQILYSLIDKQDNEVEIDLDELLDLESDSKRKEHLKRKLNNVPKSAEAVEKFIEELIEKAKTL